MGQVHALQTGKLSPRKVSPQIRRIAKSMNPTDVLHFAETKHHGLPEKVAGSQHRFLAMVRHVQNGGQGLDSASPAVASAAKKYEPKDRNAMPLENGMTSSAALTKMSSQALLLTSYALCKEADVHSILARTHKAMHAAGAKNRDMLRQELERTKALNIKLQGEVDGSRSKIMSAQQAQQKAEMDSTLANKSIEQLQMVQQSQRTPPPPEQPAYGAMLFGQPPGGPAAAPAGGQQQQPVQ